MQYGMMAQAAGSLLGDWLSYKGQKQANSTNIQLQKQDEDWQTQMSNTSYQRAVKDMEAAGLNPMLAYSQGGASTPNVAPAQVQNAAGAFSNSANKVASVLNAGMQRDMTQAQIDQVNAQTEQIRSVTVDNSLNTAQKVADILATSQQAKTGFQQELSTAAQAALTSAQTQNVLAQKHGVDLDVQQKAVDLQKAQDTFAADVAARKSAAASAGFQAQKDAAEASFYGPNALATSLGKNAGVVMDVMKFIKMMTAH